MTGPIPLRVVGEFRIKQSVSSHPLDVLSDIDPTNREEAERRIWRALAAFQSTKGAVHLRPAQMQILSADNAKHQEIAKMVLWLADPIPRLQVRASTPQRGERKVQFHSAIGQLLGTCQRL